MSAAEPIPADIEGLKNFIGGVVLDLFQMRGVANEAGTSLMEAEKRIAELEKENAELKAKQPKE